MHESKISRNLRVCSLPALSCERVAQLLTHDPNASISRFIDTALRVSDSFVEDDSDSDLCVVCNSDYVQNGSADFSVCAKSESEPTFYTNCTGPYIAASNRGTPTQDKPTEITMATHTTPQVIGAHRSRSRSRSPTGDRNLFTDCFKQLIATDNANDAYLAKLIGNVPTASRKRSNVKKVCAQL